MRKIVFHAQSGDIANAPEHESDPEEVGDDVTDEGLEEMAREFMFEHVRPEFWWEVAE
jgi:hypothetical protein